MYLKRFLIFLYFECCWILFTFADTSHDLIVHSGNDHPTFIILDFLDRMSLNLTKKRNNYMEMKIFKSTQQDCYSEFKFRSLDGKIYGSADTRPNNNLSFVYTCPRFPKQQKFYNLSTEFQYINVLDRQCSTISDETNLYITFKRKCGLIMSLNKIVTVTVNGPKTTILPLPAELVLNDTKYFILSNITKWKKNLKIDAKNQWKYTLLKNVTTSMFILDKNNPRNAVIFNGGENCSTSFNLDFHVPSKCEIKFLYKNQRLKLKSESTEETLIGQKFKLYFHEGKLVGIQMHPFKVMELNVCEIETLAAHAWKIYDVKETCQNTNFVFHQSVQIAVENITNPVKPTYKTSAKTTYFKTASITTTAKTADASTDNTWIWIVIALIILFLILVFGGLLLYNYCSTKKESKTSTDGLSKKIENHKQKIKAKKRQQKELSEAAPASLQAFPSIV